MVATLQEGKKYDGFTQGKEYDYFDLYDTSNSQLTFYIREDDNGKKRKITEREFTMYFYGKYKNQQYV